MSAGMVDLSWAQTGLSSATSEGSHLVQSSYLCCSHGHVASRDCPPPPPLSSFPVKYVSQ